MKQLVCLLAIAGLAIAPGCETHETSRGTRDQSAATSTGLELAGIHRQEMQSHLVTMATNSNSYILSSMMMLAMRDSPDRDTAATKILELNQLVQQMPLMLHAEPEVMLSYAANVESGVLEVGQMIEVMPYSATVDDEFLADMANHVLNGTVR